ncbi:hypothetical protein BDZ89DRAFT_1073665, partial [Hymenopellis radicata]
MSGGPRELEIVFLPRLVPHLYPGAHPRRARAHRGRRGDSPYARRTPCARKSSLSQVLDVDALTAEQDNRWTRYRPCPRAQSLDEFSGFEIISLCSPHLEEQESDCSDEEDLSKTLSFGGQDINKVPSLFDNIGAMERVELIITMAQASAIECYGDSLWDEGDTQLSTSLTITSVN